MTSYLFVRMFLSSIVCVGSGWALYCISPAGAAEREQSRQQKQLPRRMYREPKNSD